MECIIKSHSVSDFQTSSCLWLFILLGWVQTKECRKLFYLFHGKFYAKNMVKMIKVGVIICVFAHTVLLVFIMIT